jgi:hypothetical protein
MNPVSLASAGMNGALEAVAVVAGAGIVVLVLIDSLSTLVVTQGRTGLWRPTRLWYAATWKLTRLVAARTPGRVAEAWLSAYPAVSLLGLLVLWLAGLVVGWSLVYRGLSYHLPEGSDFGTLLYYAGASLLTPEFGTAHSGLLRLLTLLETLTGLGTIALLISYLPALYGAYSRREARLLTLDDPAGARITPVRVISLHCPDGDIDQLYRFFAEWETWTAEVLESHVSYPMLALFRSQHPGQSWVTALGVITDAATLACACIAGSEEREPYLLYRRGRRAIGEIAERLHIGASAHEDWLTPANFDIAWSILTGLGIPLREKEAAWQMLRELRAPYGSTLEQLIDFLLAPRGFWGHSAEETVNEEVARATREAMARARRPLSRPGGDR